MKIVQVVTFASPDGAFGGPMRIAENEAAALRARGHDVTVVSGHRGYDHPPAQDAARRSFSARRVLPTAGFSGIAAPGMLPFLYRTLPGADVVHVHLARDLVTLPAALLARRLKVPYVVQPEGMIDASANPLARPLDAAWTRRALTGAAAALHLTPRERADLLEVARTPLPLVQFRNAVPAVIDPPALPRRPEVLFLSRLHRRKRPADFVAMARELIGTGVDAGFAVVGPDEGEAALVQAAVRAVGDDSALRYEGPVAPEAVRARLAQASFLVLPAVDEPYATVVLESLSVGRPVIVLESNGLAPEVREHGCGQVVDGSPEALVAAVRHWLEHPEELEAASARALRATAEHFSLEAMGRRLEEIYLKALSGPPAPPAQRGKPNGRSPVDQSS